jgi:hypothetical protein
MFRIAIAVSTLVLSAACAIAASPSVEVEAIAAEGGLAKLWVLPQISSIFPTFARSLGRSPS